MPLVYQHNINGSTRIAVWHIEEPEEFFTAKVPLGREITHWHKRLQHLAGRLLLQEMYPGFPYHLIEIADTRKPFLPGEEFHFSISHCGDYAAVIISTEKRVGVDIELNTSRVIRIKQKFLSDEELSLHANHDERTLTLLWSAKEAMFKWYGNGKVDFSEDMKLHHVTGDEEGKIDATFLKEMNQQLELQYKRLGDLCLAWVSS